MSNHTISIYKQMSLRSTYTNFLTESETKKILDPRSTKLSHAVFKELASVSVACKHVLDRGLRTLFIK